MEPSHTRASAHPQTHTADDGNNNNTDTKTKPLPDKLKTSMHKETSYLPLSLRPISTDC